MKLNLKDIYSSLGISSKKMSFYKSPLLWFILIIIILMVYIFYKKNRILDSFENNLQSSGTGYGSSFSSSLKKMPEINLTTISPSNNVVFKGLTGNEDQARFPYFMQIDGYRSLVFPTGYNPIYKNELQTFIYKDLEPGLNYHYEWLLKVIPSNQSYISDNYQRQIRNIPNQIKKDGIRFYFEQNGIIYVAHVFPSLEFINLDPGSNKTWFRLYGEFVVPNWFKGGTDFNVILYPKYYQLNPVAHTNFRIYSISVNQYVGVPRMKQLEPFVKWLSVAKPLDEIPNEFHWNNEKNPSQYILWDSNPLYSNQGYILGNISGQAKYFQSNTLFNNPKGFTIMFYAKCSTIDSSQYNITGEKIEDAKFSKNDLSSLQLKYPLFYLGNSNKTLVSIEFANTLKNDNQSMPLKVQIGDKIYQTTQKLFTEQLRLYLLIINFESQKVELYRDNEIIQSWSLLSTSNPNSTPLITYDDIQGKNQENQNLPMFIIQPFGGSLDKPVSLECFALFSKALNKNDLRFVIQWNEERLSILYNFILSKWIPKTNQTFEEIDTSINQYFIDSLKEQQSIPNDNTTILNPFSSFNKNIAKPSSDFGAVYSKTSPISNQYEPPKYGKYNMDMVNLTANGYYSKSDLIQKNPNMETNYQQCYRKLIDKCYGTRNFQECYRQFEEENENNCSEFFQMVQDQKCPAVKKQNGKYWLYYPSLNQWKTISQNKDYARSVYSQNYPHCPIPSLLKKTKDKNQNQCPYNFIENNPCLDKACEGVQWNESFAIPNAPQECKREVIHYCEKNGYKDPNCICWTKQMENDPSCIQFRRQLGDRRAVECKAGDYSIQDHPDFKKYIEKDKIPCWGCSL